MYTELAFQCVEAGRTKEKKVKIYTFHRHGEAEKSNRASRSYHRRVEQVELQVLCLCSASSLYAQFDSVQECAVSAAQLAVDLLNSFEEPRDGLYDSSYLDVSFARAYYQLGDAYEHCAENALAMRAYQAATTFRCGQSSSMTALGRMEYEMGNMDAASAHLLSAIKVDSTDHVAWYYLGEVQQATKSYEQSSDCLLTSLELERSCPTMPFDTLPRTFLKEPQNDGLSRSVTDC